VVAVTDCSLVRDSLSVTCLPSSDLYHGSQEILSRLPESPTGPLHRTTYKELHARSKRLANALLTELGVAQGTVVGTLAFNTFRHLECYYAVSGIGAILHTVNPRLFLEQIEYIINHGEDDVLFCDAATVPILLQLLERKVLLTRKLVIMTSEQHMPKDARLRAPGLHVWCYETLLAKHSDQFTWPHFDENTASSLCYTSGTTGNPKGVLYSHRSTLLHTFSICSADVLAICAQDTILAIVPLFHANGSVSGGQTSANRRFVGTLLVWSSNADMCSSRVARPLLCDCSWGIAYAAAMTGAKLVLPGVALDGKSVCDMILNERVTFSFAVPTVFLGLFQYMDQAGVKSLGVLNRVTIGGAAPPRSMVRRLMIDLNVNVLQGWGQFEARNCAALCTLHLTPDCC
jgi:acyl-CoA synthetase (AMP-forming)/AMP-acid ligase II